MVKATGCPGTGKVEVSGRPFAVGEEGSPTSMTAARPSTVTSVVKLTRPSSAASATRREGHSVVEPLFHPGPGADHHGRVRAPRALLPIRFDPDQTQC